MNKTVSVTMIVIGSRIQPSSVPTTEASTSLTSLVMRLMRSPFLFFIEKSDGQAKYFVVEVLPQLVHHGIFQRIEDIVREIEKKVFEQDKSYHQQADEAQCFYFIMFSYRVAEPIIDPVYDWIVTGTANASAAYAFWSWIGEDQLKKGHQHTD